MKNTKINSTLLKNINRKKVLSIIEKGENISRVEIKNLLKKDGKTVTNITNGLIQDNFLMSSGYSPHTGGRRRELLKLNPDYGYIIGIHLGVNYVRGILIDFSNQVLLREKIPVSPTESKSSLILKIQKAIEFLIRSKSIPLNKLLGIGFVANGFYNRATGEWINAVNNLNWKNVPIKKILSEQFDVPIYLEDCSRAMALGEKYFGQAQDDNNYIYLDLGLGIGCGIIINDFLFRGSSNIAGEFGHTIVDPNGKLCSCGNHGCLETISSGWALIKRIKEKIESGVKTQITDLCDGDLNKLDTDMIFQAFLDGDNLASEELMIATDYLSVAIVNLINLFNPESIVFGGHFATWGENYITQLKIKIAKNISPISTTKIKYIISSLGDEAAVLGATTLLRSQYFQINRL